MPALEDVTTEPVLKNRGSQNATTVRIFVKRQDYYAIDDKPKGTDENQDFGGFTSESLARANDERRKKTGSYYNCREATSYYFINSTKKEEIELSLKVDF